MMAQTMPGTVQVTVRTWGNLRRFLPDGEGSAVVQLPDGATIDDLSRQLDMQHDLGGGAQRPDGAVLDAAQRG
jgi:hypothetical protein